MWLWIIIFCLMKIISWAGWAGMIATAFGILKQLVYDYTTDPETKKFHEQQANLVDKLEKQRDVLVGLNSSLVQHKNILAEINQLGKFFGNVSYAKKFVKLPKDVGSGSKFYKSLTGKYYKKHGFQIVNKEDGHPVRAGNQSIRFEVRNDNAFFYSAEIKKKFENYLKTENLKI